MDIPINVEVLCGNEVCGRSTNLVVNPVNEKVTHVIVAENTFPSIERLVPVNDILESTPDSIQLRCNKTDLSKMEAFMETDFIESGALIKGYPYQDPYLIWPYGIYENIPVPLEHKHIPTGEIIIHRGTAVEATDRRVGKVDEFLVDPKNNNITHLVLREGHLWDKKDVTIPVSEIKEITEEAVYLKLDTKAIAMLPTVPVRRNWK